MELLCLQCVTEILLRVSEDEGLNEEEELTKAEKARTLAPSWVQQAVQGQVAMACVVVPTCIPHLRVEKASPAMIASRSGLALPGEGYR